MLCNLEIAGIGMDNNVSVDLIKKIRILGIPVKHLDLSGNNVGFNGCKELNKLI
jgi:hypothetical protein